MSKFRAMALKVEDGSPSPFASTSSITLEDHSSTSPSRLYVETDPIKMRDQPVASDEGQSSSAPTDDAKMEEEGPTPNYMPRSPSPDDPPPRMSQPSSSTSLSTSPKPESTPPT